MRSILNEISALRKKDSFIIDYNNSNRYRVVLIESNGSKTAYYFSTPIYNNKTRKMIDMKFDVKGKTSYYTGSNSNITINNNIKMENIDGLCVISLASHGICISNCEIVSGNERIYPTTNGIAVKSLFSEGKQYTFLVETNKPFLKIRANDKYFALMNEKFRPFVVISCIGTMDELGNIIAPAKLTYQKLTDYKYSITISTSSTHGKAVFIEANLYEPKLFQDTTVESKNPKSNNAFGSIGFIGTTDLYGEQWLYTRPDFSKMSELNDKRIVRAILHLPRLSNNGIELSASRISSRFCSFGSNWENKVSASCIFTNSQITSKYIDFDLISFLSDGHYRLLKEEGFILKPLSKEFGCSVISTGDSYLAPQILEINYK